MTTGFQFGHVLWTSKAGAAKHTFKSTLGSQRGRGWSTNDVLAEAARLAGHCGHVVNPEPPAVLFGSFDQVRAAARAWAESQRVEVKRKDGTVAYRSMRADAPEMAAGVISFPRQRMDEWPAFRQHALDELRNKYGDRLRLVLEHQDEAHPHLHYYCVARPGEDFGNVHEGYRASRQARKEPGNRIRSAFQVAMQGWQDWLYESIGKPFGLARIGPARARSTRQRWKEDEKRRLEERAQAVADQEKRAEGLNDEIAKLVSDLERREGLIAKKAAALDKRHVDETVRLTQKLMDADKVAKDVERLRAENEKTRRELQTIYSGLSVAGRLSFDQMYPSAREQAGFTVETKKAKLKPR